MSQKSMRKHIAVVDCGIKKPELFCFNSLAQRSPLSFSYHLPGLFSLATLDELTSVDGVMVLGSASSVNDKLPWQLVLANKLRDYIEVRKIPVLGICFGHQLIASLYGASVGFIRGDQHKLRHAREITFCQAFGDIQPGEKLTVGVSHREEVKALADGFELLATAADSPIEAMKHRTLPCYTMQSHPEASLAFLQEMVGIADANLRQQLAADGGRIVDQFLKLV